MINDKTSKKTFIILLTAIVTALVAVALRCVNFFLFFDPELGYYTAGAVLPTVFNILLLALVIFFVLFSFIGIGKGTMIYRAPSRLSKVFLFLPALLTVALAVHDLYLFYLTTITPADDLTKGTVTGLLLMLVSAFSGVYFITDVLKPKTATKIELNVLTIIRLTVMLAVSYFDQQVQMNAPDKLLFGIACVSAMLFTVSELKLIVGTARRTVYTLSAATTVLLCSSASIPSVIAFHAGRLPENNGLYFEYYFLLAMAIYAAIRLFTSISSRAGDKALYASAETTDGEIPVTEATEVTEAVDVTDGTDVANNTDVTNDTAAADDADVADEEPLDTDAEKGGAQAIETATDTEESADGEPSEGER